MSQSTLDIANQSRTNFRIAVNAALQALASQNSGNTAPSELYPFMPWADTSSNKLKMRDSSNASWIEVGDLDEENLGLLPKAGGAMAGVLQLDKSTDIVAAATTDLGTATGNSVTVTHASGTLAITSFGAATDLQDGTVIEVTFSIAAGTLSVTHNATSLYIPGGANLTLADKDVLRLQKTSDSNAYWKLIGGQKADGTPFANITAPQLRDIDAAVAGNALTITINPFTAEFRSTTLTDGTPVSRTLLSAATVVVPNTATLGTINGQAARLAVLAIDNAGTIEAAVVNLAGGNQLDETNLITTTTIGTGADSNNVIYSTTGRTNVAYRVVGFIDITEAAAGVWATGPTLVQPTGGQALAALSSLGYGQTWQNLTASRAAATTYYNTTGKPIFVSAAFATAGTATPTFTIDGIVSNGGTANLTGQVAAVNFIVPAGSSYSATNSNGTTVSTWRELR
jgi:hypothetical protein